MKIHYFSNTGGGAAALRAHARYVARDAGRSLDGAKHQQEANVNEDTDSPAAAQARYMARGPGKGDFYDALQESVDGAARAADWAQEDRRHFRIILSAENAARLAELRSYTREVMARAELALGARLQWVAVDHWDTPNPHTHILLRGRAEDGRDLVIPREFVSHGFRSAARDVATERLGERSRSDERLALAREARAHGPTRLDRMIAAQLDIKGRVRAAALEAPHRSPDLSAALKARAHELRRLGLAREIRRNVFEFHPGWQEALKAMELHLDIRKSLIRARTQDLTRVKERGIAKMLGLGRG